LQHKTTSPKGHRLGLKGRNAQGNQIGVDENRAVTFIGQKFPRKGRLAGTVRARDDDNFLLLGGHAFLPLLMDKFTVHKGQIKKMSFMKTLKNQTVT
jgi:hypothetical protein